VDDGERVTMKIRFRGTAEQLTELIRLLEEQGVDVAALDVPDDLGQEAP